MLHAQQFLCSSNSQLKKRKNEIINKETDTTAIMLYSLEKETGHERPKGKTQIKKETIR